MAFVKHSDGEITNIVISAENTKEIEEISSEELERAKKNIKNKKSEEENKSN